MMAEPRRCTSPCTMRAYEDLDTLAIGNSRSRMLSDALIAFARMPEEKKVEFQRNGPYINTSDVFPHLHGVSFYTLEVVLITMLQSFRSQCESKSFDPQETLAQTMELNAILSTMRAQGCGFSLPVLLGNAPGIKDIIDTKNKRQCVSELCEYVRIRTSNSDISSRLETYLLEILEPHVAMYDATTVAAAVKDICRLLTTVSLNEYRVAAWAAQEYMFLSFGNSRVY